MKSIVISVCSAFVVVWISLDIVYLRSLWNASAQPQKIVDHYPGNFGEKQHPDIRTNHQHLAPLQDIDREFYTIRINSWERPEQLILSVNHHSKCVGAKQIQVVWCNDQKGDPPEEIVQNPKVVIERHPANSLNERFNVIIPTPTLGILSIDDDVLRPCKAIDSGFFKWTDNPERMVGFEGRLHVDKNGTWKYGYLSTTEKANKYSISLPRYCFLHRNYLKWYIENLPSPIIQMVQNHFNCEDIAMSFFISSLTGGQPPLLADCWANKLLTKLYVKKKISGTQDHKGIRDTCVDSFSEQLALKHGSNRLQTSKLYRGTFECGAKSPKVALSDTPNAAAIPTRRKEFMETIEHWKKMPQKELSKELTILKAKASYEAFEAGYIEKTKPWKAKFRK
mmetsp:Transcript_15320/g.21344  ORF Transcript_15320/g.21344 Transcript_15320/m.21344 type:complete len:394 (-) Transcript_15320:173-1354(-)